LTVVSGERFGFLPPELLHAASVAISLEIINIFRLEEVIFCGLSNLPYSC